MWKDSDNKYLYTRFTKTLHDILNDTPTFLDDLVLSTDDRTQKFKNMFIAKWDLYEVSGETENVAHLYIKNKFNMYKDYYEELLDAYEEKINMLDGKATEITISDTLTSTENKDDKITSESTGNTKDVGSSSIEGNVKDNGTINTTKDDIRNTTGENKETGTVEDTRNVNQTINKLTNEYDLPRKATAENTPSNKTEEDTTTTTNDTNTETTDRTINVSENETIKETEEKTITNTKEETKDESTTHTIDTTGNATQTKVGETTKDETRNKTISTKGQENVIKLKKEYMELLRNVYLEFVNRFEPCFLSLFF